MSFVSGGGNCVLGGGNYVSGGGDFVLELRYVLTSFGSHLLRIFPMDEMEFNGSL